jgi:hypothetical protein
LPDLKNFKLPVGNPNSENQTSVFDPQTSFDNLTIKAREKGKVKIIVGFRLDDYRSDAKLSDTEQLIQRDGIEQKQSKLLNLLNALYGR